MSARGPVDKWRALPGEWVPRIGETVELAARTPTFRERAPHHPGVLQLRAEDGVAGDPALVLEGDRDSDVRFLVRVLRTEGLAWLHAGVLRAPQLELQL